MDLELNYENIKKLLDGNEDVNFRSIYVNNIEVYIIYVNGMANSSVASDYILKPLLQEAVFKESSSEQEIIDNIKKGNIYYLNQSTKTDIYDAVNDILSGSIGLIFQNKKICLSFFTKGFQGRPMAEPSSENVLKGSKDSFVETLCDNTATIRRKIKSHYLKVKKLSVGKRTNTNIDIIYLDSIANIEIIDELKNSLQKINSDGVISVSAVEEYIIDKKVSVFPQLIYTERPDKFCSCILDGYIGFIIDGIPLGIILPGTLFECLQAPEDYSQNYIISSLVRTLRFCLMIITLILPSFYAGLITFHKDLIPTKLAIFIEASKDGVLLTSSVEIIFMLIALEILIEAGLRLPKTVGHAISIVGAIIIGQAAVDVKLVSPIVVVIISITAISGFTMPIQDFANAIRFWRLVLVIFSSIIGIFGLAMGIILLIAHLSEMEQYKVPYLAPFVDKQNIEYKNMFFRKLIPFQKFRPSFLRTDDSRRRE